MSNTRASAGGQVGQNGEWYRGGEFLPSTEMPKGTWKREQARIAKELARKVQVDFYKYEARPSLNVKPIFSLVGICAEVRNGKMAPIPAACAFQKRNVADVQALCDQWNAGEMWMAF